MKDKIENAENSSSSKKFDVSDFFDPQKNTKLGDAGEFSVIERVTGTTLQNRVRILGEVKKGLGFSAIHVLEDEYRSTKKEISMALGITQSTMTRRKKEGRLHPDESDRAVRFARIKDLTLAMMQGEDDAAVKWLHKPLDILMGESPMEHCTTELGAKDVENLIGRIRHGVFS